MYINANVVHVHAALSLPLECICATLYLPVSAGVCVYVCVSSGSCLCVCVYAIIHAYVIGCVYTGVCVGVCVCKCPWATPGINLFDFIRSVSLH